LNKATERVSATNRLGNGLFGGLAGVGWTIEHVSQILDDGPLDDPEDDPIAAIDTVLIRRLRQKPWMSPYDLISGLVGIGVYFLERLPRQSALDGLSLVIEQLDALSEKSWGGTTWHTPPHQISAEQRQSCPDGYYNLGVAHGVPGIVQFLAESIRVGVEEARCSRLLEGAVKWLLARQRPPDALSRYSNWFVPGEEPSDSRVAWCYGDLGIAAVWLQAARAVDRADWRMTALTLLERSLNWPVKKAQIIDTPLCHGAFGVAHIANRAYHATGDDRYRTFANTWYERALAMRRPGSGVAGFPAWRLDKNPNHYADPSFLAGAIGVVLALEAAVTSIEPNWDRMLLISGR
jgi:hypothetical protein